MSPTQAQTLKSSLLLIKKKNFAVEVGSSTWNGRTKRIYRGKFEHKGTRHNFSLTDPVARRAFEDMEEGGYTFKDV